VLIENKWGELAGNDDKARVNLVVRFFNEIAKENSGRAVRGEVPLNYEEAKSRWARVAEEVFPNLTVLGLLAANHRSTDGDAGRGRGGRGGKTRGGRGGPGSGSAAATVVRQAAMFGGLQVCYPYNSSTCTRPTAKPNVCKDTKGNHFAHACNWQDKSTGKFCLQPHPRHSNH